MDASAKYATAWETPKGPGDSRPTAREVLKDEGLIGKLNGKVIVITGCSSGLGIETARALKATGARLFLTARNMEKGKQALQGILEPGKVDLLKLNLESLESVRTCAEEIKHRTKSLNILITNAGIRHVPKGRTKDGFEMHWGTNHVSHFLLFQLLKPMMLESVMPDFHSRVVALSSTAHREARIDITDLNLERRGYNPVYAYSQSKLANVYMANEIERRYGSQGLHAWSVHPGGIRTGLQRPSLSDTFMVFRSGVMRVLNIMQSPEQGSSTTVWAATAKSLEGKGGKYLERCTISEPLKKGYLPIDPGHSPYAYDQKDAESCWAATMKSIGMEG
jgi:NAD(P)-dependent dehydrogenase (short-subunit alcohol dehydrogenase family)